VAARAPPVDGVDSAAVGHAVVQVGICQKVTPESVFQARVACRQVDSDRV